MTEPRSELDSITVTLTNDDFWRIRTALAESAIQHQGAADRCSGSNQRSTDTILQHEHVVRRMQDVEEKLVAAFNAPPTRTVTLTDSEDAVVIDSLAIVRDRIREIGGENPPNIISALDKIKSLMTPRTVGLRLEAIEVQPQPQPGVKIGLMAPDHDVPMGTFTNLEEAHQALQARTDGWTLVDLAEGPNEGYIIELVSGGRIVSLEAKDR
jgi:hypothetical protein